jgi:nucleoside transporter
MAQGEPSVAQPPSLGLGIQSRLSVMMFLQFAIWGSWAVVLSVYLEHGLNFDATQIGWIISTLALGTIFTPLVIGQIADRYFASEKLMGILHLLGAALLVAMTQTRDANVFFVVALLYAFAYSPTLVLANSITFAHVPNSRYFPWIRVFGTLGWIAANYVTDFVLPHFVNAPDTTNMPLLLAAGYSVALGLFSFALPHTPPAGKAGDAFPALRAVGLLRSPSFAVFFGVSFIITIVLAFYYTFLGNYLKSAILPQLPATIDVGPVGVPIGVASVSTIGQISEVFFLILLPLFLRYVGMKWVLAIGMLSWGLRYLIFAMGASGEINPWLVIASLTLHGVCFDFFFAAGFIYVDQEAPHDIRASGQALFTFLTYGLGMWLGNILSGYIVNYFSIPGMPGSPPDRDWYIIWLIPSVGVLISLVIFVAFFHIRRQPKVKPATVEEGKHPHDTGITEAKL